MKLKPQTDIWLKWELYTQQQQEAILLEFRKRLPDDYYCKTTFLEFLNEKLRHDENFLVFYKRK